MEKQPRLSWQEMVLFITSVVFLLGVLVCKMLVCHQQDCWETQFIFLLLNDESCNPAEQIYHTYHRNTSQRNKIRPDLVGNIF